MLRTRALAAAATVLLLSVLVVPIQAAIARSSGHVMTTDVWATRDKGHVKRITSRRGVDMRAVAAMSQLRNRRAASLPYLTLKHSSDTQPRQRTSNVVVPPAPVQATITSNPAAAQPGVDGLSNSSRPATMVDPPDPWVAAGPDYVMQAVNTSVRITDRTGTDLTDADLGPFWQPLFTFPVANSDPRVIFDSRHGRWVMTEVLWDCNPSIQPTSTFGHGYLGIAVSDTANPNGTWSLVDFVYPDYLPDYPAPGTSTDKIAFSSNLFQMTGSNCVNSLTFAGADTLVMNWSELLKPTGFYFDDYFDGGYYTPRTAVQAPAADSTLRLVAQWLSTTNQISYIAISGSVGKAYGSCSFSVHTSCSTHSTPMNLTEGGVIQEFLNPQPPQQPSGNVTTAIDSRPTDAIWQNNKLTFVSTQACTPTGDTSARDCVRVSQLNTSTATPTLAQDFLIAKSGKDSYLGGVGVTGNGALFVSWTQSSATSGDYPSSYAAYQLPTDAANSISPAELLAAGQSNHTGGRWGDYVGVAQDPQDPNAVWQGNEYVPLDGTWATHVNQLKTGNGSTYVPMAPVRLLDTRSGNGLSGAFTNNTPRTFTVAGRGGVPANAVAVTGNLTVTGQTAAGYVALTVYPTSSPSTSTLNFPVKDSRANNVTIPLSATGTLSAVYQSAAGQTTQLIFDVTGYFLDDGSGATYSTVTPARLLDSRNGTGGYSTPFVSGQQRSFPVWLQGGVPNTASAVTGNLTITGQTSAGYVTLSNVNTNAPTTSTLNFPLADIRANGVSVALTGTGSLYAVFKGSGGATVHVIFDVTGYYVPGTGGLRFFALNPGRILDGRSNLGLGGTFSGNSARTLAVAGHLGVPVGAAAITGNLTVTGQSAAGYAAMTPVPTSTPSTSTINFPKGDNRANGVAIPLSTGGSPGNTSLVYKPGVTPATTYLLLDITGYFK